MTKKILRDFVVLSSVMTLFVGVAFAGDYHTGINLICSDCHVMHASQSHGYNANGGGTFTPLGATPGGYEFLLRNDVNDLCKSCHDGQSFAPDVFEGHTNGYLRQAGALNDVSSTGIYHPENGHTLGSTAVAPGGTFQNLAGLECVNCHSPHGRATTGTPGSNGYRNLYSSGNATGSSISYSRGDVEPSNDLTRWVYEDASSGVSANHYGSNHITFNEPLATDSQYANFCKSCHADFHGASGGAEVGGLPSVTPGLFEEFKRHPAGTVNIGQLGGGHSSLARFAGTNPVVPGKNQVQVMSPTGVRAGSYLATNTDLTPSCMSCHKGHGNQNAFGLIFMLGSGTITEEGDGPTRDARNLCRQCHGMGGSSTTW